MNKAIITVLGADRVGIIAAVSTYLAAKNVNILDISQTTMQDVFTMIMMVDTINSNENFDVLYTDFKKMSEDLGVQIQIQAADIFNSMHKI